MGQPSFGYFELDDWEDDIGNRVAHILNQYFEWHWKQLRESVDTVSYVPPLREIPPILESTDLTPEAKNSGNSISGWLEKITDDRFSYVEELVHHEGFGPNTKSISRYVIDNHAGKRKVRFQDVGVGMSQVIPVLQAMFSVYRLRGFGSSVLLLEQPELHLHPRMQGHLMDAIMDCLEREHHWQQILVETHSESMVLRLQKKIAAGELNPELVSIIYVDSAKPDKDGEMVRRLHLDVAGKFIEPWPESFTDLRLRDMGF
jgi:predicted ATPase